jgi:hypothetical protein
MFEGKVKIRIFSSFFFAIIFYSCLTVFLLWWFLKDRGWQTRLLILSIFIFFGYKSGFFKALFGAYHLHRFTITVNGIISKEGHLIPWTQIKEVVFLNLYGDRHLGIRLKENEYFKDGKLIDEEFKNEPDGPDFKMPILIGLDGLNMSEEELGKIFGQDYKIPVRYAKNWKSKK